jgi:hypothetical protein
MVRLPSLLVADRLIVKSVRAHAKVAKDAKSAKRKLIFFALFALLASLA